MPVNESTDRRKSDRGPIELKVEYQRINTFFSDYATNISQGGTFIKTDKPLDLGTEFVFRLHVPELSEPLRVHGIVQWIVSAEEAAMDYEKEPGMGIRFVYERGDSREEIEDVVEGLMVKSLGRPLSARLMRRATSQP